MEGSSSGSIDKSRVLDVKPLRVLVPVFPSSPECPPFVCTPPLGPYPPGLSPFYPFNIPSRGDQEAGFPSNQNTQTPTTGPTPLRSYRASQPSGGGVPIHFSGGSNGDTGSFMYMSGDASTPLQKKKANRSGKAGMSEDGVVNNQKKLKPRKKPKKGDPAFEGGNGSGGEYLLGLSLAQREDGNRETVDYVLIMLDALRRRLSQLDDCKPPTSGVTRRPDLKSANILMSKMFRTNGKKRIGIVPGVEIGDIFFFRMEMCLVGVHSQSMAGIDTINSKSDLGEDTLAVSIVSSGGYDDEADDTDVLIYSGQGGNMSSKDKMVQVADQKLVRGNLALDRSTRRGNEIRVIRGVKDIMNPLAKVYVYDGLYTIQESWVEKGKSDCNIFKYKLIRQAGQPSAFAIWKSVQKWREGFASRSGLILPDLSSGAESQPVSLVNEVDKDKGPAYFTYIPSLKNAKPFSIPHPSFGCNCRKACAPGDSNCACIQKNGGEFPYTTHGVLVSRKPHIHECGPTCPCFPNCKNRVTQTGLKVHLEVFKTEDRGWGLRSWDPIRAGTFICQYTGEVIEKVNGAGKEGDDDYVFDTTRLFDDSLRWNYDPSLLDGDEGIADANEEYKLPSSLRISSKNVGNVARFMNHSCYPNLFWQPIVYEIDNEAFVHIAFFAIKHIPPMTELTYDYGVSESEKGKADHVDVLNRKKKCLCGSPKCRGYFG